MFGLLLPTITALLYLVPTLVAVGRRARLTIVVVMLNLLLGWTILGWIIAMLIASTSRKRSGEEEAAQIPSVGSAGKHGRRPKQVHRSEPPISRANLSNDISLVLKGPRSTGHLELVGPPDRGCPGDSRSWPKGVGIECRRRLVMTQRYFPGDHMPRDAQRHLLR